MYNNRIEMGKEPDVAKKWVWGSLLLPLLLTGEMPTLLINENVHRLTPDTASLPENPLCKKCHPVSFQNNEGAAPLFSSYSFTLACLTCHDGNTAKEAPVKVIVCDCNATAEGSSPQPPLSHPFMSGSMKSHPVLIDYPGPRKGFRAPSEPLNGEWKKAKTVGDLLRDGKIVCISCHLPHYPEKNGHLRTTMHNSALCYGCHPK